MARKKKVFPEVTLEINALSHDGRGIGHIDGKTAFVHGALVGEKVLCKVVKQHRRYAEAKTLEVIQPSDIRSAPSCEHYGICGGCSMQHMNVAKQIEFKQQTLLEQLKHFGQVTPEIILPPIFGNSLGYRKKARLGVRYVEKKGKLFVGFREKMSNFLTDIQQCPVLHQNVGTKIHELSALIQSLSQYLHIPQIEVAIGDDVTALVIRHMQPLSSDDLHKLIEFGKTQQFHLYLQPNPPEPIRKIWPEDEVHTLQYRLDDYDMDFTFHPLSFTQVNSEMNQQMVKQAIELLEPTQDEMILDLFCGLGNFTLPLARFCRQVIGVEGSQEMVTCAAENATRNHIKNASFYAANLMNPSNEASWMQNTYDKILLDPPRAGAKEIIPYFPQFSPKKIVYVSCNPATLARDAHILVSEQGYQLKKTGIINMFPHTSHIEAIALFEK
jgi:23S rRNA (uracil1939-C5)-methyltransferase